MMSKIFQLVTCLQLMSNDLSCLISQGEVIKKEQTKYMGYHHIGK